MSRTDKDMPDWVSADWWEPFHTCIDYHSRLWYRFRPHGCDLPAEPVVARVERRSGRRACHWVPVFTRDKHRGYGVVDVVPDVDQHRHCAGWLWD